MAKIIEEVAVRIGADTRNLEKGMKRSKRHVNALTSQFKKLGVTMLGIFGARAVFRSFTQTLDVTNKLIKTAKGVGFLASEYQELTFAMNQVGVRSHSAIIALGDFQKRLGKAVAGTSPQFAKAFRDAGLDPGALSKLDPAEAFDVALNRLASLKGDPRLAGLTGAVFEEQSGKDVLKIIRQWEAFTAARVKHASRVSVLDKDQQFRIEFLAEEVGVYKAQWEALKSTIVADSAPAIVTALKTMEDAGTFELMGDGLTRVSTNIAGLVKDLTWLGQKLDSIKLPAWMVKLYELHPAVLLANLNPFNVFRPTPDRHRFNTAPGMPVRKTGVTPSPSPQTVVHQTNNFSIGLEENAKLNKAWRKLNEKHMSAP